MGMSYVRFGGMIAVSVLVMYGLTYVNVFDPSHIWFSQTRVWMALIMGSAMAAIMLGFMWKMYNNRAANIGILVGAGLVFVLSLGLMRSQALVGDVQYMEAMIPHHSIAILTSENARIRDPRVRELADGIIEAQVREIREMEDLIASLRETPTPSDAPDLPARPAD
jgi:Na+/proline symporter